MERDISLNGKNYFLTSDDNYLDMIGQDFEPHMVDLFQTLIDPNAVVADVGGNIGLTSILFSELARKVYTFEPSPSTFEILRDNLKRAGADNVFPFNVGLGERQEQQSITFAKNNRSGGFVSDKIRPRDGHVTEQINLDTLDNFFSRHPDRLAFMKIDVEGFEANVIKGGQTVLHEHKPIVVLEMNHFCLNALRRITIPDFLDFLRSVFPCLYAVDSNNASIADLHNETQSYHVMHEHIVRFRYPNLVAGFDTKLAHMLEALKSSAQRKISHLVAQGAAPVARTPEVDDARGKLVIANAPVLTKPDHVFFLEATMYNESDCDWLCHGDRPVRLSYHWQDLAGNTVVFDGERTAIGSHQILPGERVTSRMKVVAPFVNQKLRLIATLVQDGVCWFEARGFKPEALEISIADDVTAK